MTTSLTQLHQALSEPEIKLFWLGYFQEGLRSAIQQELLEIFESLKKSSGFTRSDLAKKIGRRPEQVTRWLSAPTNLESDTISDLALGMGFVPRIGFERADVAYAAQGSNQTHPVAHFVEQKRAHPSAPTQTWNPDEEEAWVLEEKQSPPKIDTTQGVVTPEPLVAAPART